jgi:tetratricopeptide (TPR) repeat protein
MLEGERGQTMRFTIRFTIFFAAAALSAQDRFDMVVRNDFFSGFAGNREALDRGMKKCEEILAANPKHAEAMVWHGSGELFISGEAARDHDYVEAVEFYQRGIDEMASAVALEPDNVAVRIPRGATLLTASRTIEGEQGRELLLTGLADYEAVYAKQQSYFETLSTHARAELLFGLGEGYMRSGDQTRAREWFEKLIAIGPSGHLDQAKAYLATGKLTVQGIGCAGCHVSQPSAISAQPSAR